MATPVLKKESHPRIPLNDDQATEEEQSFFSALELVTSSVLSLSMQSVIELGIFDIIAKEGPNAKLSSSEIAAHLGAKNPEAPMMLDRILGLLTSHSVLNCSVVDTNHDHKSFKRLYSLTPVSKHFVTNEDGVSLGPLMATVQDKVFIESWSHMKDAVFEGGFPFGRAHGMHAFKYSGFDQRFSQAFNSGMFNHTTIFMKKILELYRGFEHLRQLVDVGGGLGVALNLITSRYPHVIGINYDLPHVVKNAPSYPGVEHVGGDMFEYIPSADAIFMKGILHDWLDEDCLKLLKNCHNALPNNGKIIVVEALLPVIPESSSVAKINSGLDVQMMTQTPGGKERSQKEFMTLATSAGFHGIRYECFVANMWVMEFFK